jgi:hypothetical protein
MTMIHSSTHVPTNTKHSIHTQRLPPPQEDSLPLLLRQHLGQPLLLLEIRHVRRARSIKTRKTTLLERQQLRRVSRSKMRQTQLMTTSCSSDATRCGDRGLTLHAIAKVSPCTTSRPALDVRRKMKVCRVVANGVCNCLGSRV